MQASLSRVLVAAAAFLFVLLQLRLWKSPATSSPSADRDGFQSVDRWHAPMPRNLVHRHSKSEVIRKQQEFKRRRSSGAAAGSGGLGGTSGADPSGADRHAGSGETQSREAESSGEEQRVPSPVRGSTTGTELHQQTPVRGGKTQLHLPSSLEREKKEQQQREALEKEKKEQQQRDALALYAVKKRQALELAAIEAKEAARLHQENSVAVAPLFNDRSAFVAAVVSERHDYERALARLREAQSNASCVHTASRNYTSDPVQVSAPTGRGDDPNALFPACELPGRAGHAEVVKAGVASSPCSHGRKLIHTMENLGRSPVGDNSVVVAMPKINADVYMQYGSWAEYNYLMPPRPAAERNFTAFAMITNCAPPVRKVYLEQLQAHGVVVHSFAGCLHNRQMVPRSPKLFKKLHKHHKKLHIGEEYKFSLAFENSDTPGYVTEKLFGMFVVGVVPIYFGSALARDFMPSNRSVIFVDDFKDMKELAEYLIYLDGNDTAYDEYLQWKIDGPSAAFIANMDISLRHSLCRIAMRSADLDRRFIAGPADLSNPHASQNDQRREAGLGNSRRLLRVRERGRFWLRDLYVQSPSLADLQREVRNNFDMHQHGDVYEIYRLWDTSRKNISNDVDAAMLRFGDELEVVFTNPDLYRPGYSEWRAGKPAPGYVPPQSPTEFNLTGFWESEFDARAQKVDPTKFKYKE